MGPSSQTPAVKHNKDISDGAGAGKTQQQHEQQGPKNADQKAEQQAQAANTSTFDAGKTQQQHEQQGPKNADQQAEQQAQAASTSTFDADKTQQQHEQQGPNNPEQQAEQQAQAASTSTFDADKTQQQHEQQGPKNADQQAEQQAQAASTSTFDAGKTQQQHEQQGAKIDGTTPISVEQDLEESKGRMTSMLAAAEANEQQQNKGLMKHTEDEQVSARTRASTSAEGSGGEVAAAGGNGSAASSIPGHGLGQSNSSSNSKQKEADVDLLQQLVPKIDEGEVSAEKTTSKKDTKTCYMKAELIIPGIALKKFKQTLVEQPTRAGGYFAALAVAEVTMYKVKKPRLVAMCAGDVLADPQRFWNRAATHMGLHPLKALILFDGFKGDLDTVAWPQTMFYLFPRVVK